MSEAVEFRIPVSLEADPGNIHHGCPCIPTALGQRRRRWPNAVGMQGHHIYSKVAPGKRVRSEANNVHLFPINYNEWCDVVF